MRETLILALLCIGLAATSDLSGYEPRGWRPNGRRFNPDNNRLHEYYGAPGLRYGYEVPNAATTAAAPTTAIATAAPRPRATTTTTPRSREPTTAPSERPDDDDLDANPALAIANSFAFNRPVYVYNAFPPAFLPAQLFAR